MKIFLDDIREPKDCLGYMYSRIGALNPIYSEDWVVVRNYDEFINVIEENYKGITHVSFDHDLADEHYKELMYADDKDYYESIKGTPPTGYDCAKWLKDFYENNKTELPIMFVHSMNPAGTRNIINVFKQ